MANLPPVNVDLLASQMIFSQSFTGSTKNKTTFNTAVAANSVKVAYVGHSIVNGNNQNFYGATVYRLLQRAFKQSFPTVAFTFRNYGIGGSIASQFLGTSPATAVSAITNSNVYRENWEGSSLAASQANGAWRTVVSTWAPDLIVIQWDLNETDPLAFATAMQAIIDDINNNAAWASKRPSIVLISSHTGIGNGAATTSVVRRCHKILRTMARANGLPLLDAGRLYDIYTQGVDPVNLLPNVSGEIALGGVAASGLILAPSLFESKIGTAYCPAGSTIRDQATGVGLRTYRNKLSSDGAIQASVSTGQAACVASLFYRADPTDNNYATGTGTQYELRISGTTAQVYFWSAGVASAVTGSSVTLTSGTGSNTVFIVRAEVIGADHKFTVIQPDGSTFTKEFVDYQYLGAGYLGFGYSVAAGFYNIGAAGNVSNGFVFEYWDQIGSSKAKYQSTELLGTDTSAVWNAGFGTSGGNSINHLNNLGHKLVYEPLVGTLMRQLQVS